MFLYILYCCCSRASIIQNRYFQSKPPRSTPFASCRSSKECLLSIHTLSIFSISLHRSKAVLEPCALSSLNYLLLSDSLLRRSAIFHQTDYVAPFHSDNSRWDRAFSIVTELDFLQMQSREVPIASTYSRFTCNVLRNLKPIALMEVIRLTTAGNASEEEECFIVSHRVPWSSYRQVVSIVFITLHNLHCTRNTNPAPHRSPHSTPMWHELGP